MSVGEGRIMRRCSTVARDRCLGNSKPSGQSGQQGGMIGGMRVKTSVPLDERVLKAIDKATSRTRSRSRVLEDAAPECLARRARAARETRDRAIRTQGA